MSPPQTTSGIHKIFDPLIQSNVGGLIKNGNNKKVSAVLGHPSDDFPLTILVNPSEYTDIEFRTNDIPTLKKAIQKATDFTVEKEIPIPDGDWDLLPLSV